MLLACCYATDSYLSANIGGSPACSLHTLAVQSPNSLLVNKHWSIDTCSPPQGSVAEWSRPLASYASLHSWLVASKIESHQCHVCCVLGQGTLPAFALSPPRSKWVPGREVMALVNEQARRCASVCSPGSCDGLWNEQAQWPGGNCVKSAEGQLDCPISDFKPTPLPLHVIWTSFILAK